MANRAINFLGYQIDVGNVDDIERSAVAKVQESASRLYAERGDGSVAVAWISAVLEFLYQEGKRQEAEEFEVLQANYKVVCDKSVKQAKGGSGATNE